MLGLERHPRLRQSRAAQKALAVLTQVLSVAEIRTDQQHLDLFLQGFPNGVADALGAVRQAL